MIKKTTLLFAMALGTAFVGPAQAAPQVPAAAMAVDAAAILAEVDRRAATFDDQSYTATMQIIKAGQLKKTLTFNAVMKGLDRQLLEFVAPGDVAGMKVLLEGTDNLYIYLPEFKKVRRVAAHVQNQGFLGSTFTLSDMAEAKLSPLYDAEMGSTDGSLTTLILTPKAGIETSAAKIELVIDGTKGGVTKLRYFDSSGTETRQQLRDEWIKIDDKFVPTQVSMLDLKTGDVSVIKLSNLLVNQGVEDDLFSRRTLLRE